MEIGDIRPVSSVERTSSSTAGRQPSTNPAPAAPAKASREFSRTLDDDGAVVYRILDEQTGIILMQVPSEQVRHVANRLQQMLSEKKAG